MVDHADEDNGGDIFVYRGGRAPQHVTYVIIDKSVDEVEERAFLHCEGLVKVEFHDGIRKVGMFAFYNCASLPKINLKSVAEIGAFAFYECENLADVVFGDNLETIGASAFAHCTSLTHIKLPSIVTVGTYAFELCQRLIDIELSERLATIGLSAFSGCERLRHVAIPLKRDLFPLFDDRRQRFSQFEKCSHISTVDLVGGIHKTIASLHMESWRTNMLAEINRINRVLPNTPTFEKSNVIRQWMESVLDKIDHYKAEHCRYVKEGTTLLELALWKAKLNEKEESSAEGRPKKAKVDAESARKERRITCGADMVIKNVLPFLELR